jgi:serine protease Do
VVPKSPAAKAGVQAGDLIVALNGKQVESSGALTRAVALIAPGKNADLTIQRGKEKKQVSAKVAQRPEDEAAVGRADTDEEEQGKRGAQDQSPKLGVSLAPLTPEVARQFGVQGDEGVLVVDVTEGGPADRAGVRKGDVILELNRQPVRRPEEIKNGIAKAKDGEIALLRVRRGDAAIYVAVPVGGRQ